MCNDSLRRKSSDLLAGLSNLEKADLCSGRTFWHLHGVERLGLPSVMVTDGPHGLRKQAGDSDHIGLSQSVPAICFPSGAGLASTWNRSLLREVGTALGEECLQEQVSVLLGPGVNIKRSPLCGRNFEYFSEDPYLSGEISTAWVQGVQSQGVGASLKHYAVNNQESHRLVVDTIVDQRTLREIYLPGFEATVRNAQPWTVMCSYNLLNGTYLAENKLMLTDILRDQWQFEGLVVTDWGAANERVQGLAAGLDLDMPGNGGVFTSRILGAIESGELAQESLDAAAGNVVDLILKSTDKLGAAFEYDADAHHALARRAAEEACVLLKNDKQLLPLSGGSDRIAVIGAMAKQPRYQGAGSSQITPTRIEIPLEEIGRLLPADKQPLYSPGYSLTDDNIQAELIDQAVAVASQAETVIVVAGLPDAYESEGFDRDHMRLPANQIALIERLAEVTQRLVVVLQNGSPVELPFVDQVPSILEAYLGGQAGASAIARVLFGKVNPAGKLAETFPLCLEDTPCHQWFPGAPRQVQYREGIWVGYRYYCSADIPVAFPFGHGLSYTQFSYKNLRIVAMPGDNDSCDSDQLDDWSGALVECDVENVGAVAGWDVVQLYVHDSDCHVHRPRRELRGFDKIWLVPGETGVARFTIGRRAFAYWDSAGDDWVVKPGEFTLELGASSQDIRLSHDLLVTSGYAPATPERELAPYCEPAKRAFDDAAFTALLGHELPRITPVKPFHMNSTLGEVSDTLVGKFLYRQIQSSLHAKAGPEVDEKFERMISAMMRETPLRSLVILSGGKLGLKTMTVMIDLMNRRLGSAIRTALSRV